MSPPTSIPSSVPSVPLGPSRPPEALPPSSPQGARLACVAGRYELRTLLKHGRGVATWAAVERATGRDVVLKLAENRGGRSSIERRLAHEAAVLRQIDHARVVPLLEIGRDGDCLFLVMPRAEGQTLAERLRGGPLPVAEALAVHGCVLEALEALHAQGVVHRDVKPSNVIVDSCCSPPCAVVIDAGLSRCEAFDDELRDVPVGTARYISPEQAGLLDREIGPPSDLYSAGVMLYESLAGAPPFTGETVGELLRQHLVAAPPDLRSRAAVPRALDQVIQRMLAKDPRERYQSAAGVRLDLEAIRDQLLRGVEEPVVVVGARDERSTVTEPSFIGRAAELDALDGQLGGARAGVGELVLLEGESGVGKSRLLDEWAHRCRRRGALVLRGQGVSQTAQRPFQMLAGVAEGLMALARLQPGMASELRARAGEDGEAIADLLPELRPLFQGGARGTLAPEALGEQRGLKALEVLLDALGSKEAPAVVLLDDMQWSDEMTLKLLARWRRASAEDPSRAPHLVVVAAFRSEIVSARHPIRELPATAAIALPPFTAADVDRMAESSAGPLPDRALEVVRTLSEGNPFMVSAVLRGLIEAGAIRRSAGRWHVRDDAIAEAQSSRRAAVFLSRRLDLLPAATHRLLVSGAVLGKEFDAELARSLAGLPLDEASPAQEDARARHLVWTRDKQARCVFVHDKLREALLGGLDAATRRAMHLRAAEALEARSGATFDVAYHYDAAGDSERALPFALAAAEEARGQHALEIAERQYRIAGRARQPGPGVQRRVAEGLGDVLMLRGSYAEAEEQFRTAQALTRDPTDRATIEGKRGELAFKRGDVAEASASIESGLRLLGRVVPRTNVTLLAMAFWEVLVQAVHTLFPRAVAARTRGEPTEIERLAIHLYSRLAYAYWFQRGKTACLWAHLREMNLAERHAPSLELAQAYSEHAPVMTMIPMFARGVRYAERSLAIRRSFGDVWGQGQSHNFRGVVLYAAARFEEALEDFTESVRLLERTGDRWEANTALWNIAYCHYRLGHLREAIEGSRRVYQVGQEIGDTQAMGIAVGCWAKATEGRVPAAAVRAELQRRSEDVHTCAEVLQAEGLRCLAIGDTAGAVDALVRADGAVRAKGLQQEYVAPVVPMLATALRARAVNPALRFAPDVARSTLRRAASAARRARRIARLYPNNLPHALRESALVSALLGRPRRARRYFAASLDAAERQRMTHERALTIAARALVGESLGWPEASSDSAAAEKERFQRGADDPGTAAAPAPPGPEGEPVSLSLANRFPRVLDAGRRIATALTRDAILSAVEDAATALLRGERSCVYALGPELDPEKMPDGVSLATVRRALATGRVVVATEGVDEYESDSMVLSKARSTLCAPIVVRGRAAAYLYVTHDRVAALFGAVDEQLAEFVATLAGAALENAENFARIEALSKERERLLVDAQRALVQRDDFLSVASHELKTPVTSLWLNAQLLERGAREGALTTSRDVARIAAVEKQSRRLGQLMDEMLDLSRLAHGGPPLEREDVDLLELAQAVAGRLSEDAAANGSAIGVRGPAGIVGAWDRTRLEQVVTNLLTNAVKFGEGGRSTSPSGSICATRASRGSRCRTRAWASRPRTRSASSSGSSAPRQSVTSAASGSGCGSPGASSPPWGARSASRAGSARARGSWSRSRGATTSSNFALVWEHPSFERSVQRTPALAVGPRLRARRVLQRRHRAGHDVRDHQREHHDNHQEARREGQAHARLLEGELHEDQPHEDRLHRGDDERHGHPDGAEVREAEPEAEARERQEREEVEEEPARRGALFRLGVLELAHRAFPGTR